MRIISKFKDYYDSGSQYGHDVNVTLVRNFNPRVEYPDHKLKSYLIDIPSVPSGDTKVSGVYSNYKIFNPFIIWIAGTVKLGYKITSRKYNKVGLYYEDTVDYVYGDNMIKIVKSLFLKSLSSKSKSKYLMGWNARKIKVLESIHDGDIRVKGAFEYCKDQQISYFEMHGFFKDASNDTRGYLNHNIKLGDYQLYKAISEIQAYQMIETFIPTILHSDTISEMTDEQKIRSHGLDETSFRCEAPGNKKSRRRENKERKRSARS